VLFAQVWLLLDCCDGEVARWRRTFSAKGVYLDGLSHSLTQAALPAGLGIRADGGWSSVDGWTALGLLASLLVLAVSLESHLVHSVRARDGKSPVAAEGGPRAPAVREARRVVGFVPFHRALNPIEATLLALGAAVVDASWTTHRHEDAARRRASRCRGHGGRPSCRHPLVGPAAMGPSFGCIVLTEGRRPDDLQRALDSLRSQHDIGVDVAVVGNGWKPEGLPGDVHAVELTENRGVSGGRNAGVEHVRGDFLLFLDHDARFRDEDPLARIGKLYGDEETLGAVSPRVEDPDGLPAPR
jgi:phosphatidylglycerophosphate synthase